MRRIYLLVLFAVAAMNAYAQQTSIVGTVTDSSGAVVKAAEVSATQIDGGGLYKTKTNNLGEYQFPVLNAATYLVRTDVEGFAPVEKQVTLLVGQTIQVALALRPATVHSNVKVVAEEATVDTISSAVAGNIDPDKVSNVPLNGRNYLQLASLVPGIRVNAVDDSPLATGTITGFQLNVDGQQVTQNYAYSSGYGQPKFSEDAIAEFQVITNRFDATQGRSNALQINIQTKSGSNATHGSAFGYFRNDFFNAADPIEQKVLPYSDEQFGGTVGGPIKKDKLFYFGSYEGEHQPNTVVLKPYGFTSVYPTYTHSDNVSTDEYLSHFDYLVGPNDRISLRASGYTLSDPFNGVSGTANPTAAASSNKNNYGAQLNYSATRGLHFVNDIRAGFTHNETKAEPAIESPELDFSDTTIGGNYCDPENINQEISSLHDDAYWLKGKHSLKFGGEYLHELLHGSYGMDRRGQVSLTDDKSTDFPALFPNLFDTTTWDWKGISALATTYVQTFGPLGSGLNFNIIGFWGQDDWKLTRRLTVNLGLRYDNNIGIFDSHVTLQSGVKLPHGGGNKNFSPRIGFAWDPAGTGKTVIRGGAGIYYSEIPTNMIQDTAMFNGQTEVVPSLQASAGHPIDLTNPFGTVTAAEIIANPLAYKQTIQAMSPDVVTPWTAELSIGAQKELPYGITASADYLHNRTHHDWTRADANLVLDTATGYNEFTPGATPVPTRPNSYYNAIKTFKTPSSIGSIYDALLVSIQERTTKGFTGSLAYTLARLKDNNPYGPFGTENNPFQPGTDWADGIGNQLHTLRLNGDYLWRHGIRLGGLYSFGSGANQLVYIGSSPTGLINNGFNLTYCGADATNVQCNYTYRLTTYNNPKYNHLDTRSGFDLTERNNLVGRPVHRVDASLGKDITIAERFRTTIRIESFNLLNHSNYGSYNYVIFSPAYGQPASTSGTLAYSARMLQFSAHLHF
jgi:hypothetical protein